MNHIATTRFSVFAPAALAALLLGIAAPHSHSAGTDTPAAPVSSALILTPKPGPAPRINGPSVYGCRPGNPFLYRIPCTGERPMTFGAKDLPATLALDSKSGIITGTTPAKGEYTVTLRAENSKGSAERTLRIVAGETLALTPPMGWNTWYVHFNRPTDGDVRAAADAMVSSGMADAGYQYIGIDDAWANTSSDRGYIKDSKRVGPLRDAKGNVQPNTYFPDMKALTDYVHAKGLKAGIYTSPGPVTCVLCCGAYQHEEQDARQFADWGFDLLKYDWCSYDSVKKMRAEQKYKELWPADAARLKELTDEKSKLERNRNRNKEENDRLKQVKVDLDEIETKIGKEAKKKADLDIMKEPYVLMGTLLRQQKRDIVYNLCQYGMGDVWKWGAEVGGNSWRTAGDLGFELTRFFQVALRNAQCGEWSKPGAWNDPDYIQIGCMGKQVGATFTEAKPCPLTPNEQYAYFSLWSLMASPLFFSGDMRQLDELTLSVLCNPEVIEVDQDPLGLCAKVVTLSPDTFLMIKPLADGGKAVGLFNQGKGSAKVTVSWKEAGLEGRQNVRDLWRQVNLGVFAETFSAEVPDRGVVLVKMRAANTGRE